MKLHHDFGHHDTDRARSRPFVCEIEVLCGADDTPYGYTVWHEGQEIPARMIEHLDEEIVLVLREQGIRLDDEPSLSAAERNPSLGRRG